MQLYHKILGERGQDIIILHGLLGMSDNWMGIAKQLATKYRVHLLDLRNHGRSPHTNEINYKVLSEDIFEYINQNSLNRVVLLGHSMGGKVAMYCSHYFPLQIDKIIIVDIAPKKYIGDHEFIFNSMKNTPLNAFKNRTDVELYLKKYLPENSIRQLVLKNLGRKEDNSFKWDCNLESLIQNYSLLMDFEVNFKSDIPAYFIKGQKSDYILDKDIETISKFYTNYKIFTIPSASHWVHADNPTEFLKIINIILEANS